MKELDYKNPKWQRKRLEVMQAKGFKCEWCESEEKELHVHHVNYEKDKEPWEYKDINFMVLCKDCHESFHQFLNLFATALSILNKENRMESLKLICDLVDKQI